MGSLVCFLRDWYRYESRDPEPMKHRSGLPLGANLSCLIRETVAHVESLLSLSSFLPALDTIVWGCNDHGGHHLKRGRQIKAENPKLRGRKESGPSITWLGSWTCPPLDLLLSEIINILTLKAQLCKVSIIEWCHSMDCLLLVHVKDRNRECLYIFTVVWWSHFMSTESNNKKMYKHMFKFC